MCAPASLCTAMSSTTTPYNLICLLEQLLSSMQRARAGRADSSVCVLFFEALCCLNKVAPGLPGRKMQKEGAWYLPRCLAVAADVLPAEFDTRKQLFTHTIFLLQFNFIFLMLLLYLPTLHLSR